MGSACVCVCKLHGCLSACGSVCVYENLHGYVCAIQVGAVPRVRVRVSFFIPLLLFLPFINCAVANAILMHKNFFSHNVFSAYFYLHTNGCMSLHVCVCVCVCMCVCICDCVCMSVSVYMSVYVHVRAHVHLCQCLCDRGHVRVFALFVFLNSRVWNMVLSNLIRMRMSTHNKFHFGLYIPLEPSSGFIEVTDK